MRRRAARADQHRVPDDTDHAHQNTVERTLLLLIREMRNNQIRDCAKRIARDGEDLDHSTARLGHDSADNGRQKSRETIKHSIAPKLRKAEQPDFPILEALADIFPVELSSALGVASLSLKARSGIRFLVCTQKIRGFGRVGQDPPCCDTEDEGRNAFQNHDPPPAALPGDPVHVTDCVGEETAACAC